MSLPVSEAAAFCGRLLIAALFLHEAWSKVTGYSAAISYAQAFGVSSANGYERLLLDAMLGDLGPPHGDPGTPADRKLLDGCGLQLDAIERFEINEAFGAQVLSVQRDLQLDANKLNVNGGAIAIGHPLAATGIRLGITLARELRRAKLRYGVASACIGGGQGIAMLLENAKEA